MAGWKELGYVPDSDDEDSDVEDRGDVPESDHAERQSAETNGRQLQSDLGKRISPQQRVYGSKTEQLECASALSTPSKQVANISNKLHPDQDASNEAASASVAERLEVELTKGLATCGDILSRQPSRLLLDDDSPLSSLPSSPEAFPVASTPVNDLNQLHSRTRSPSPDVDQSQSSLPTLHADAAGRSLRPRALMQVHPYTIEYAKYHQDWKARGMQPIRPLPGQADPRARGQEETQDTDVFQSSSNVQLSSRPSSSPARASIVDDGESQSPVRLLRATQRFPIPNIDDELPDLADIFNGHAEFPQAGPSVKKRRRRDERRNDGRRKTPRLDHPFFDLAPARETDRVHDTVFDMPLSPPRSASLPSSMPLITEEAADRPNIDTPGPLPTPMLSSDCRITKRTIIEVSSSSETSSKSYEESTSSPILNNEESQGLVGIKRMIKGVLPASWLKLDARQQNQPATAQRSAVSPGKATQIKGVARHVSSGRPLDGHERQVWPLDFDSDGEESESLPDDDERQQPNTALLPQDVPLSGGEELLMEDVAEEDEVDAMLPSVSRVSRNERRLSKRRQQRLEDSWIVDECFASTSGHHKKNGQQDAKERNSHRKSGLKRRRMKHKTQLLTVLDAPGLSVEQNAPRFLKLAARGQGPGRTRALQDPRQKFFQLGTEDDTIEINRGLRNWTSGLDSGSRKARPHSTSLAMLRKNSCARPIHLHTNQEQTIEFASNVEAQVRELKDSTNRTLNRLQGQSTGTTGIASTEQWTHSSAEPRRPRHLGVFFSHINRSGQGKFLNPVLMRAAQLEAPQLSLLPPRKTIRPPEATQNHLLAPIVAGNALRSLQSPVVSQISRFRRKIPPKMAANADNPECRPGSTSTETYSYYGEPEDFEGYLTAWMGRIDQHVIEADLETLTSPTLGDYSRSPYVSHGNFAVMLNNLDVRRDLHAQGSGETIPILSTVPIFNDITSCVQQVEQLIPLLTAEPRPYDHGLPRQHIRDIFRLLQSIQDSLGLPVWFCEVPGSARIPQSVFDGVVKIFNAAVDVFSDGDSDDKKVGVFLVGQVLVIAYQLAEITSEAKDEDQSHRSYEVVNLAARYALKMAMIGRMNSWQDNISDPFEGAGRAGIVFNGHNMGDFVWEYHGSAHRNDVTYIADTIIIIYHLFQRRIIPGLGLDFSNLLYELCHNTFPLKGLEPMLFSLGVMRLVHPLTRLNAYGKLLLGNDTGFSGWDILTPAVNGFMVLLATLNKRSGPSKKDLVKAHQFLVRHCFAFLESWNWKDPDTLLKVIFHVYAENNMGDLLSTRRQDDRRTSLDLSFGLRGGETDFECFLKLIITALKQKQPSLDSSDEATRQSANNKVQSLVWSLLPNSTSYFNAQLRIHEIDYQSLRNRYDLNLTLYVHAPAKYRPSPRQVSCLVEFAACPPDIRELVIIAWTDMARYAMNLPGRIVDVDDLVNWGRLMLSHLFEQFKSTNEPSTVGSSKVTQETLKHRAKISGSLADLLRGWTTVLNSCPSGLCDLILSEDFLTELKAVVATITTHLDDTRALAPKHAARGCDWRLRLEPYIAAMQLLAEVLTRSDVGRKPFRETADGVARDIVSTILSSDRGCADHQGETCSHLFSVIVDMTRFWFKAASGNIDLSNAWDKYLAPHSSHSFALLANSEQSRQANLLFMAMIIHHNPLVFRMDRATFYAAWIEGLVVPEHLMAFEHCLTAEIHRYDMDTSFLGATIHAALIQHPEKSLSLVDNARSSLILERLKQDRLNLVKTVIGKIRFLQCNPPSDDSQNFAEESLDGSDMPKLLKVMTDTMKRSWQALPWEKQPAYAEFIWEVVSELQKYVFDDYRIDEWFTEQGNGEFPTPSSRFADQFSRPVGAPPRNIDARMSRTFRVSLIQAVENHEVESWLCEMSEALSCNASHLLATSCQLTVDSRLQIQFLRVVCSAYIEQAFETPEVAGPASVVVRLLVMIVDNASLRLDEANDTELFARMLVDLLCRLGSLLRRVHQPCPLSLPCTELALVCYKRFRCLQTSNQSSEVISGLAGMADCAAQAVNAIVHRESVGGFEGGLGLVEEEEQEKVMRVGEGRSLVGLLRGGKEWREGTERRVDGERLARQWEEAMSDDWGVEDMAFLFL